MNQFQNYFDSKNIYFLKKSNSRIINFLVFRVLKKLFFIISSRFRIINYIKEINNQEIEFKRGVIKSIYFCNESYFQSENYIKHNLNSNIKFKEKFLIQCNKILERNKNGYDKIIFVHIRRGDYLYWPTKENPAAIPIKWYFEQITYIKSLFSNSLFLLISSC